MRAGGPRVHRPTNCAICRCGTSWCGSIRSTRTTRACRRCCGKGRGLHRGRQADAAGGRARDPAPGDSRVPRRAANAGRSSCRPRRSITRSCRCCATSASTARRIPSGRRPRNRSPTRRTPPSSCGAASALHTRLFGDAPAGALAVRGLGLGRHGGGRARTPGFAWMATDEEILGLSLGLTFRRDSDGVVHHADALYRPYRRGRGRAAGRVRLPRSHAVRSDRLHLLVVAAEDAARRLRAPHRGRRAHRHGARGAADPMVFVILDGENAWEHFEGQGRPFLRALYRELDRRIRRSGRSRCARPAPRPRRASTPTSRLVDPQRLLHLGRPRRRPPRLGPAGQGPPRARATLPASRAGPRPGARVAAHRRRQRLVLVVWRRSLVGSRSRLRRAVPAPPAATSTWPWAIPCRPTC